MYSIKSEWMLLIGTQKRLSKSCEKPWQTALSCRNLLIRFHNSCPKVIQKSSACHYATREIRDGHMSIHESSQFEFHFDSFCYDALALLAFQLLLAFSLLIWLEFIKITTVLHEYWRVIKMCLTLSPGDKIIVSYMSALATEKLFTAKFHAMVSF